MFETISFTNMFFMFFMRRMWIVWDYVMVLLFWMHVEYVVEGWQVTKQIVIWIV